MGWFLIFLLWIADVVLLIWGFKNYSFFNDELTFWESLKGAFWVLTGCSIVTIAAIVGTITLSAMEAEKAAKKAAKAAGEAIDNAIDFIFDVILCIIDIFTVKEKVREKVPNALKVMILEKKNNSISVGIFPTESNMTTKMTLSSEEGVAEEIYENQVIYI